MRLAARVTFIWGYVMQSYAMKRHNGLMQILPTLIPRSRIGTSEGEEEEGARGTKQNDRREGGAWSTRDSCSVGVGDSFEEKQLVGDIIDGPILKVQDAGITHFPTIANAIRLDLAYTAQQNLTRSSL